MRLAYVAALIVAGTSAIYAFGLYPLLVSLLGWPLLARMFVALVLMLPLAAMGVPFPVVLHYLGQSHEQFLPWAWAVNVCASVVAGLVATLLALAAGLPAVMLAASGCYLLAAAVVRTWNVEPPADFVTQCLAHQAMTAAHN